MFRAINKVTELSDRFRNLEVDSRLEIVFKGKPKGFEIPSHAVFTHQSEYGLVIFEVETRVTSGIFRREQSAWKWK